MARAAPKSLGQLIRDTRISRDLSLRELARQLGKAPSYLSDIENDRRVPAEDVLRDLSQLLGLPFDNLMALAGRLGQKEERYVRQLPEAATLFRRIYQGQLGHKEVQALIEHAERLARKGTTKT